MITELATVTRCDGDRVEVRLERQAACGGCSLNQGCGVGALGRLLGKADRPLQLDAGLPLQPGDRLQLQLSEAALVRASLTIYGLPLLGGLATGLAAALAGLADPLVVAVSVAGFCIGLKLAARWSKRLEKTPGTPYIIDIQVNPAVHAQSQSEIHSTGTSR